MSNIYRRRRLLIVCILAIAIIATLIISNLKSINSRPTDSVVTQTVVSGVLAKDALGQLLVKGRAPKTDYARTQFGDGWTTTKGCDMRNIILNRDLTATRVDEKCDVISGVLNDPYTGKTINFVRGNGTSADVQIDHVVALSDAWQKGAQQLSLEKRAELANDPLELLAVDGPANQQKSDGDAATWLPAYKPFRCQYVARQVAVKQKYALWVTPAEKNAITNILSSCPRQTLPIK